MRLEQAFFSTAPEKLKDETTQTSSKNSKIRQILQLQQKSTEMTKKQGGN